MPFIRLNAGHDKNGNPRRAYVLLNERSEIVAAWDEGYRGWGAIPEDVRREQNFNSILCETIPTTRTYLRSILKQYGNASGNGYGDK